ncbi:MAG TPA: hypothetical protein VGR02_05330 [Thermoanaerobaculia bacterium]|jgi:hypothetical protein|nr:hypothetical protein [Thermoanaerobaculia bacterium]
MARKKKGEEDHWARYFAIQLTPEQKAAARAEAQKELNDPETEDAYDRIAALRGKVHWSISYEQMASKEEE